MLIALTLLAQCSLFFPVVELTIYNESENIISGFHLKEGQASEWSPNLLPAAIPPHENRAVYIDRGIYGIKIDFQSAEPTFIDSLDIRYLDACEIHVTG